MAGFVYNEKVLKLWRKEDGERKMKELEEVKKSISASLCIALGSYVLLMTNGSVAGAVLFSLGLFAICTLRLNLFTGKCGFLFQSISLVPLLKILVANLVSGYLIGLAFSVTSEKIVADAAAKVAGWDIGSVEAFAAYGVKSLACGMIMYLAVLLYQKGTPVGIFLGIPMFILSGFQHCIANVIVMGMAREFHPALILCIFGNWAGSLLLRFLLAEGGEEGV